jgi:hypothetical protein
VPAERAVAYALGWQLGTLGGLHAPSPKYVFGALDDWKILALIPLVAAGLIAAWSLVKPARAGLIFAGLAYLPASNLVPLTRFVADVYLYLPLAGLAWAAGALVEKLPYRPAVAATVALMLTPFTWRAEAAYRDPVALWSRLRERYPSSPQVCRDWGDALVIAHRTDDAVAAFTACDQGFGDAWAGKNLGIALFLAHRDDEARAVFERLDPRDPVVQKYLRLLSPPP